VAVVTLVVTTAEGVTTLLLDRPAARNALTTELLSELRAALVAIGDDPDVRVVVLTGAGSAFCAGADLKELPPGAPPRLSLARIRLVTEVVASIRALEQPTIAAVNGPASGAGWGLALACDLCFAAAEASFCLPEVRKGLRLPSAIVNRLAEVVGPIRAAEIAFGGDTYSVDQGLAAGWVSESLPDAPALAKHTTEFARELATRPRSAVSTVKQVLRRSSPAQLTPPPEYSWNEE
jgi:2-(1,2-epoxy-1,2-dihydrophenyl)acetyl-CoA isomerase